MKIQLVFIILYLFGLNHMFAQDQSPLKPIIKVLKRIETKHNVKFSYSDELLSERKIVFNDKETQNIEHIIKYLQTQTGLKFKLISKNRYAIFFPTETQSICGYLYDSNTNERIGDATILTQNKTKGTISNNNGFFELKDLSANDSISISIIGYKIMKRPVSEFFYKNCLTFFLEEEITHLNEVIISNYLTKAITKTIDGAIVFKQKKGANIPGLTESDVLFTVQQIPGILNVDETASSLHIRGGSPNQNLVLYNGIKLYNTVHFFGAISAINPQTVDKVTVYKSASNAKYGNHIAGVVDIESSTKIAQILSGSIGSNLMNVDANLNIPISPKLSLSVSGRRSLTDIFDTPTINNFSDRAFQYSVIDDNNQLARTVDGDINTDFYFYDYSAKLNYKPSEKDYFTVSLVNMNNNLNHQFSSTELEEKTEDNLKLQNVGASLQWQRQWSEKTSHNIYIGLSDYQLQVSNQKFQLLESSNYATIDKNNQINSIDLGLDISHKLSQNTSTTIGYQYSYYDVSSDLSRRNNFLGKQEFFIEDNNNDTHTLFAEYQLKKDKDYALNFGLRSNYFSLLDKFTFEPRLFAQVKLASKFWLNSSFDLKQQNISKITESFTKDFGLENEVWVLADNTRIPLLKSQQVALGAIYEYNNWLFDVDIFYKKIKGLTSITSGFETFRGLYVGEGSAVGLDLLIRKKWQNFNTWISYHTGRTSFEFDGFNNNEKFDGNFDVSHAIYWSNHFKYRQFNFSLGWNYRVGVPFTSAFLADSYFIGRDIANAERLPNFHRLDASCTYNFFINRKKSIKAEATLSILNLYDKRNILQRNYDVTDFDNPESGTLIQEDIRSIGFTPNVSFRLKF